MGHLHQACIQVLRQLELVVEGIRPGDFSRTSPTLGGSTIGQHVRHTIEFFQCLEHGLASGVVNYDHRAHDELLESHPALAVSALQSIRRFMDLHVSDRAMALHACYRHHEEETQEIATTYFRELAYNLEHAVHHMAIIRMGLREEASYVQLPPDFGMAASTLRYQRGFA